MSEVLRPYIGEGDYVKAERSDGKGQPEEGIVYRDIDGELRITKPADADPHGPDGLPVNARWVNILSWKENI